MKTRNLFWGLFFVAAAVFIIISAVTGFANIDFWTGLLSVLLAAVLLKSIIKLEFFGIFVPAALLYLVWRTPLGLPIINGWTVLLAAVLLGIGLEAIFHKRPFVRIEGNCRSHRHHGDWNVNGGCKNPEIVQDDDNNPSAHVRFGSLSKYLHGQSIRSGSFSVNFGALELFLDTAQLAPEGAEFNVDCSFGAIELHVPRTWRVIDKTRVSLGGVEVHNSGAQEGAPTLTVTGNVSLGGMEIKYI